MSAATVPGWSASQNAVAAELEQIFTAGGLSKAGAAGIIGNWSQESSLNPAEPGGLLAQWGGSRLTAEQSYAAQHGQAATSVAAQGGFALQELAGYPSLLSSLKTTTDPQAAALAVSTQYERPRASAANNPNREAQATAAYQAFGGSSGSGGILGTIGSIGSDVAGVGLATVTGGASLLGTGAGGAIAGVAGAGARAGAGAVGSAVTAALDAVFGGLFSSHNLLVGLFVLGGFGIATYGLVRLVGAHPGADAAKVATVAAL